MKYPIPSTHLIADPGVMDVVDSYFEGVKRLFDQVSIDIVELIAQSKSSEGSQIVVSIDEKHSFGDIVFPGQSMKECSVWVSSFPSEDCDFENQL